MPGKGRVQVRPVEGQCPNQRNPRRLPVSHVVIHYTANGTAASAIRWFMNPRARASAHFVVDRDGEVFQVVPLDAEAWHAGRSKWEGRSNVNRFSVGIELVNWGLLQRRGDGFFTWPDDWTRPYQGPQPILARSQWWEPYATQQLNALYLLCADLCEEFDLLDPSEALIGHEQISPKRKRDPGGAFDWTTLQMETANLMEVGVRVKRREPAGDIKPEPTVEPTPAERQETERDGVELFGRPAGVYRNSISAMIFRILGKFFRRIG